MAVLLALRGSCPGASWLSSPSTEYPPEHQNRGGFYVAREYRGGGVNWESVAVLAPQVGALAG